MLLNHRKIEGRQEKSVI